MRISVGLTALLMSCHSAHADAPDLAEGPLVENPGLGDRGYRHGEHHHQYTNWHNQLGTHCCNSFDCRITTARWEDGGWTALVDGEWRRIESDRHVRDDLGVGPFASVCASRTGIIWCFDPPEAAF